MVFSRTARATPRVLVVLVRPQGSPRRLTGGGEVSTIQIALHLHRLGVDVFTVERRPSVILGHAQGLKVYTFANRGGLLSDIIGVIRMARKSKCDSIYAFTDYVEETIVPCFLAAFINRKKLFVNVLGAPGVQGTHRLADSKPFFGLIRDSIQREIGFKSLVRYMIFQASRRLGCRLGTCLVATHFVESYTKSLLHPRQTFVVGRGVEKLWFDRAREDKTYDGVYSGRFDRSKRVPVLVKAWQMVVAKKPDAKLLLIGDPGEEFPLVKRFVSNSGLSSNVTFAGFVQNRTTLAEMIRSARLFIFPSVKEGFGLVVAEAMAAGLPCILSDIPTLRETFGETAMLVRPDDPSAFAEAILGLLFDDQKRKDYSERSKSLAVHFTWEGVAKKVLNALTNQ